MLFLFFGESLILITFSYSTLIDLIPSSSFTTIRSHMFFNTHSGNAMLSEAIAFFILFFMIAATTFLVNLRYPLLYSYFRATALTDFLALIIVSFAFWPTISSFSYPTIVFIITIGLRYTQVTKAYFGVSINVFRTLKNYILI